MSVASPLLRQWIIIRTLSSRRMGASVRELATEAKVSERTIRRDLRMLRAAGFPLEEQSGDFGRKSWRIDPRWPSVGLAFTYDEALALYAGQRFLEPLAGTQFWEAAQRAFRKIRASLGEPALRYLDRVGAALHHTARGTGKYAARGEILDQILIGIEDNRAVFLTYQSARATEPVTYDIYPYGITFHRGSLYVVGHAPRHDELRHWKVDRIAKAEVTEVHFQRPADFDLRRHFADSFGVYQGRERIRVVVRFARDVARYVSESTWHPSQKLATLPSGDVRTEFELSSTVEVKSWLLSFGRHAEVLAPAWFREEMANEVKRLAETYANASASKKGERIRELSNEVRHGDA